MKTQRNGKYIKDHKRQRFSENFLHTCNWSPRRREGIFEEILAGNY